VEKCIIIFALDLLLSTSEKSIGKIIEIIQMVFGLGCLLTLSYPSLISKKLLLDTRLNY
jgi:hypothetical protein